MGSSFRKRIVIVVLCLAVTSIFVHYNPGTNPRGTSQSLRDAIKGIGGWKIAGADDLDRDVVKALELDDYVNEGFVNEHGEVFLYVGFYYSAKKVGAAHSPLVCYPGQGWQLSQNQTTTIGAGGREIHLSKMIVARGGVRHLVLYWFQAYDRTSAGTLGQKLDSLLARLMFRNESNAFVRVSVPLGSQSVDLAMSRGVAFIREFYPIFLHFIENGG